MVGMWEKLGVLNSVLYFASVRLATGKWIDWQQLGNRQHAEVTLETSWEPSKVFFGFDKPYNWR